MASCVAVFAAIGVCEIAIAVPLMRRLLKPTSPFRLHMSATHADEWVWYEANAGFGRDLFILGLIQIAATVVPVFLSMPFGFYIIANSAIAFVGNCVVTLTAGLHE